jgi:hypothetical protein
LTNWQRYDIILLSVGFGLQPGRQIAVPEPEIWEKEQEMIGGSLRTMEAFRDQRFPEIRQGEQRNPTVPSSIGRQRSGGYGRRG